MKNVKLLPKLVLMGLVLYGLASCTKQQDYPSPDQGLQDVTFASPEATKPGLKATAQLKSGNDLNDIGDISYASIIIDGVTYTPAVYYLEGIAYTQAIKLESGVYNVTQFLMMNDNGTPANTADDIIVSATPEAGSEYAAYVNNPTPFQMTVTAFEKNEIDVEILQFESHEFTDFGFNWFTFTQVTVREQLFFGDISAKHPSDYIGSLYENQANGLQVDMPAIFKIDVYRNDVFIDSYNNESYFGEGAPLHVTYPDQDNAADAFRFELSILVKIGDSFGYKHFHTWTFQDDELITAGSDGIVDFVLGNSNATAPDLLLPPYQNLPVSVSYTITGATAPGSQGGYVDATLAGVGNGYDFGNGTFASWCADNNVTIYVNQTYGMDVYSSLYPTALPAFTAYADKWARINWLFNNLDLYPNSNWGEVQGAIWLIMGNWNGQAASGVPAANAAAYQMASDSQLHTDFSPLPGGWAAVVFVPTGTDPNQGTANVQTMFIQVDP